jgi:membrane-associated phospholipid phosphatase
MHGLPAPVTDPRAALERSTDRTIRLAGALTTAHLAATLWPAALYTRASGDAAPLAVHTAILTVAAALVLTSTQRWQPLRDWLPVLAGPFLYVELRWLIAGLGRPHADATVLRWEALLFPGNPSATWAPAVPVRAVSEALHLAYASYYLLVLLPPILLYLRGRRDAYASTVLALVVVYGLCFAAYLVFPVDGPRYLVGPAAAPHGPIRAFVLHLLAAGSSRGTAFPSSHVAASVVASLCALRFQRPVGIVVSLLTIGLTLGTVYGGFHYAVDALAGLIVGVASWTVVIATTTNYH